MVSFIQGVYVTLGKVLKGIFSSYSLLILFAFPVYSFASTLSHTFLQQSGNSGIYKVQWNCTGYYCHIYNNGTMMGGGHQGSGSYNVTIADNATHTVKMDSFNYNPYGGYLPPFEIDNMTIQHYPPRPPTPAAPNLPSTSNTSTYNISWTAVSGATYYKLYEKIGSAPAVFLDNVTGTSFIKQNASNNTYSYQLSACNSSICSLNSPFKSIDVAITPGIPASISATPLHDGDVDVDWGLASGSVTKYELQRNFNGGTYSKIYEGTSRSQHFPNYSAGTYRFRVNACRTTGSYTSCSDWRYSGNSVAAVPSSAPMFTTIPANDADGTFDIGWGGVVNTQTYELQEREGTVSWGPPIQNTSATTRLISGKGNNTYGYQVRACNDLGCSAYSTEMRVDVAIAPGVPASITAPALHDGNFSVTWGIASGSVTKYDLDHSTNGVDFSNGYDGSALGFSYSNSSQGAATYTLRVRACRTTGAFTNCSGWRTSSASVAAKPASAPGGFTVPTGSGEGAYLVDWDGVANSTTYALQEKTPVVDWTTIQNTSAVSRNLQNKTNGSYSYRVAACNALGCSGYSPEKRVDVALAPAVPVSITATYQGGGQLLLQWAASSDANRYQVYKSSDAGSTFPTSEYAGASTSKTTSIENQTYAYRVQACQVTGSYTNCSGWKTSSTISRPAHEISVTQNYTYDPLGRLTFVEDTRPGMNRDYDYDRAGNRTNVSVGSANETESEPGYPSEPRNLSSVYSGNCYFNVSWTSPVRTTSDTYYILVDSANTQTQTSATNLLFYCQYNASPPNIKPISLKACNSAGCSYTVNFEY